jgi:hypothetical protein
MSPISAREGHRSKLAAQAPDGKTARRPATRHGDGGPHAKARDDKPERRFSGLLSAMTGASGYRTHQPVSPPALRAFGLRAIFREARRAFDRACFANTLHLPRQAQDGRSRRVQGERHVRICRARTMTASAGRECLSTIPPIHSRFRCVPDRAAEPSPASLQRPAEVVRRS